MEPEKIAGDCEDDECEAVYRSHPGKVRVRGDLIDTPTGPGEAMVEVTEELLVNAVRALGRQVG